MNRIEMYASTRQLRHGLHRVLAVAHALTEPVSAGQTVAWWTMLEAGDQESARTHELPLAALARVCRRDDVRARIDGARAGLGLAALDTAAVQAAFRAAHINDKAHRAHGGRDAYGASNKAVWDLLCADFGREIRRRFGDTPGGDPVRWAHDQPSAAALEKLRALTAFDTRPAGGDHGACVAWLAEQLGALGFHVDVVGGAAGQPLIVAKRPARGLAGHLVLYGHYDVAPYGREQAWRHPPGHLTLEGGRLFARGVADNKGPLACRLAALGELPSTPAMTWIIQGEEETGSPVAHAHLPEMMRSLRPTLWLDETGYHDHEDGAIRLLGRTLGADDQSLPPDAALEELLRGLRGLASRWGLASRHECRGLNKSFVAEGCPFNRNLPVGARYLAIGVNDSRAHIHALDESVPGWTFPLHVAELDLTFRWVSHVAGGTA